MEKQFYVVRVCVCSLRYVACIAHAPSCFVICGHSGRTIFFRSNSLTGPFSGWGEEIITDYYVLIFSTLFL